MIVKHKIIFSLIFVFLCSLVGCTKTNSLIFDVNTNDSIKVTSKVYDLKYDENNFIIYDVQNKKIGEGFFIPKETYKSLVKEKNKVKVLKEASKNNNPYFLCPVDKKYVFVIYINQSHTGIYLTCSGTQKQAENLFDHLNFEIIN